MKHRALTWLLAALLCLLLPAQAFAAESVDLQRPGSLTLHYTQDGESLSGQEIALWRVGDVFENGTYALIAPYPVEIQGITSESEWQDTAATLSAYLVADAVQPHYTATTDETGTAVFAELPLGLYLIRGLRVETATGTAVFEDFFLFLPRNESGTYTYAVEAAPKHATFLPGEETVEYSLLKLWKDDGHHRPTQVKVDILQDGRLRESVVLSAENDWTYAWTAEPGSVWTVAERDVPEGYQVTLDTKGNEFLLTNTFTTPVEPPDTGDTFPLYGCIMAMSLSGLLLILLGLTDRRERRNEAA